MAIGGVMGILTTVIAKSAAYGNMAAYLARHRKAAAAASVAKRMASA